VTTEPVKKAASTTGAVAQKTGAVAKKAARSAKGATKKAARSTNGTTEKALSAVSRRSHDDPRPLEGYAALLVSYGALTGALSFGLRRKGLRVKGLGPMDLLLYGLATEHLSRVITKDSITSVLRAPFARFKEAAGEGEVNEEVVGDGVGHALGELLTCPFCAAQWVATGLVAGSVMAPALTTTVIAVSAAARASDYLNLVYGLLRQER
jgi:hypothetical protein